MSKGFFTQSLSSNGRRLLLDGLAGANVQLLLDASYRIIGSNENVTTLLGYSPIGKPFFDLFTPVGNNPGEIQKEMVGQVRRNHFAIRLGMMTHKNGDVRQVNIRWYGLEGNKDNAKHVVMATDMTAAYQAEAGRAARVDAITRSYAVIEFDQKGHIVDANDVFCKAMGYRRDDIIGKEHRIFAPSRIMSESEYSTFWRELAANKVQAGEFERVRKDGSSIFLEASYTPVVDLNGRVTKVVKIATDITEKVTLRTESAKVASEVDSKLGEIVNAVSSANDRSASASSVATQTSQMVRQVADAVQDFEHTSRRIADAMVKSRTAVGHVNTQAQTADRHISELSEAASSMTSIVEIISKVAGQINLLALNATIEAARAGEAGKGFAVVAAEVKSLADQVEKSTNQIGSDIDRVQNVAGDVVSVLKGISSAIREVEESVTVAGSAVEEQSSAAREIAAGMNQAAQSVHGITDDLSQISAAVASANGFARDGSNMYRSMKPSSAVH
ncbi:chemotaxis protein [Acuticoccus sediminis]|uniref:Chemotaxis protein n=1 Tax=Acuticoccus sediminis TaxID=2184697 RepID=A0A8B2NLU7_9HYPH|nr:PAS domain-containing methyl-accepting chemotaxis protein [Acuticoccus sediminis]RAI00567.1 chemotaxis protein [Acuticoccus sediminis]